MLFRMKFSFVLITVHFLEILIHPAFGGRVTTDYQQLSRLQSISSTDVSDQTKDNWIQVRAGEDEELNPLDVLPEMGNSAYMPFITQVISELQNEPNLVKKLTNIVDELLKEYTMEKYPNSFMPALLTAAQYVLTNNKLIDPMSIIQVGQKLMKHYSKQPNSIVHNAYRLRNKSLRIAGNGVAAGADLVSGVVKTGKDLFVTASELGDSLFGYVPILSTVMNIINGFVRAGLEGIQISTKFGGTYLGDMLLSVADESDQQLKVTKMITKLVEEKIKQAKELEAKEKANKKD